LAVDGDLEITLAKHRHGSCSSPFPCYASAIQLDICCHAGQAVDMPHDRCHISMLPENHDRVFALGRQERAW
jgi:hypothetical protein